MKITIENTTKIVTLQTPTGEVITSYTPHWRSCQGADQFRRKL